MGKVESVTLPPTVQKAPETELFLVQIVLKKWAKKFSKHKRKSFRENLTWMLIYEFLFSANMAIDF